MILQLKELFDIIGKTMVIDCSIGEDGLNREYASYSFAKPAEVKGRAENRAGIVTLFMEVKFSLNLVCDRCLKEFTRDFCYDFEHILVRNANTDSEEYVECEDNVLDLDELVVSDILLRLPTKILCREDCRGLCSMCGQDLNEGECSCFEK